MIYIVADSNGTFITPHLSLKTIAASCVFILTTKFITIE